MSKSARKRENLKRKLTEGIATAPVTDKNSGDIKALTSAIEALVTHQTASGGVTVPTAPAQTLDAIKPARMAATLEAQAAELRKN